jgi:ribosome-associated protein
MDIEELRGRDLEKDFIFSASRSGGPGGQNVNKVSTKVELRYNLIGSEDFSEEEKQLITEKLKNRINKTGEIIIISQVKRSQLQNKEAAIEKFYQIIARALTFKDVRKPTVPTKASKLKRLENKKIRSDIKKLRKDLFQ